MIEDFLFPLIAVGLAELGDKTQLSIILASTKTKKHLELLLGVVLAFLVVDGIAVLLGSWVTSILPESTLKIVSGAVFIFFGILILKDRDSEEGKDATLRNPFISGFALIFMTEWGDKTQIASALFATKYDTVLVLAGVITALTLLSTAAVYLGKALAEKIDKKKLTTAAGILFILMGLAFFII